MRRGLVRIVAAGRSDARARRTCSARRHQRRRRHGRAAGDARMDEPRPRRAPRARLTHGAARGGRSRTTTARRWRRKRRLFHTSTWVQAHVRRLAPWRGERRRRGHALRALFKAFMASEEHRANILEHRLRRVGTRSSSSDGYLVGHVDLRRLSPRARSGTDGARAFGPALRAWCRLGATPRRPRGGAGGSMSDHGHAEPEQDHVIRPSRAASDPVKAVGFGGVGGLCAASRS